MQALVRESHWKPLIRYTDRLKTPKAPPGSPSPSFNQFHVEEFTAMHRRLRRAQRAMPKIYLISSTLYGYLNHMCTPDSLTISQRVQRNKDQETVSINDVPCVVEASHSHCSAAWILRHVGCVHRLSTLCRHRASCGAKSDRLV